ncbi:MAG: DUF3566 domain-containing protein [Actinomycetota bacterium]
MVHTADQPNPAEPRVVARPSDDGRPPARPSDVETPAEPVRVRSAIEAPASPESPVPSSDDGPGAPAADRPPRRAERSPSPTRAARAVRAPRSAPRRTRVVVRKVAPLSVLKFSLLFYVCLMLIVFFALVIVYVVLSAAGAIDSLEKVLGYVFGTGTTSTSGAEPLEIDGRVVFTWGLVGGLFLAVVWAMINVFVALLYNLISDIVGGVEVTLAERPSR